MSEPATMTRAQELDLRAAIAAIMGRLRARTYMDIAQIEAVVSELEDARVAAGWEPLNL